MQKMKSHAIKGMQFHNQREKESKTNGDIDKTKTHLNYDLVNPEPINYNEKIQEIINTQKTSTRKTRSDAVLVNELLVTSDRDFFDGLSEKEREQFFQESYKLFAERYGEQNVAYATVHNDEKTPHMHLGVVPMRDGKLQSKNVFDRQELRWIQDEFPKHMKSLGFEVERGEKGSDREHVDMLKYKEQTLNEKIQGLETELSQKQQEKTEIDTSIQKIQSELQDLSSAVDHSKRIDEIDFKESGFINSKSVKLERFDFDRMKTLAKVSEALKGENETILDKNTQLEKKNMNLEKENLNLKKDNKDLQKENQLLKQENKFLQRTLEQVKYYFKDQVQELAQKIGYLKSDLLDRMNVNVKQKHFADENEVKGAQAYVHQKKEKQKEKGENELE
ncbi:hypothetical protein FHR85_002947 [Alkalibacillus almallahensis]|nr:hypothetical protein [Alkalibacillus almallahensis]